MKRKLSITFAGMAVFSLMLATLSCGGFSNFFATPTPTPTNTPTNTPTVTPSPTLTPSPTPTSTPTPLPEALIQQLADGSTQFKDLKGGYQIIFPKGWLVINLAVDDPAKALEDAKQQNPDKAIILGVLNTAIQQKARMATVDLSPNHYISSSAPAAFAVLDDSTQGVPLETILEENGKLLPQLLNAKVKVSKIKPNQEGVSYGEIDINLALKPGATTVNVYEKLVLFKTQKYTVFITFAVLDSLKSTALPDIQKIIDSIELLNP